MNDKELALLERLIGSLGESTESTIDAYVLWHVAQAAFCVALGIALLFFARWSWKYKLKEEWEIAPNICAAVVAVVLGFLLIGTHIADLVAPRAIAIHQLLNDIVP